MTIRVEFDGDCHYHQGRQAKAVYWWKVYEGKNLIAEASGTTVGNGLTPTAAQWEGLEAALEWLKPYKGFKYGVILVGPEAVVKHFGLDAVRRNWLDWMTTYRDTCQKLLDTHYHGVTVRAAKAKPPAPPKRTGGGGRPRGAYSTR